MEVAGSNPATPHAAVKAITAFNRKEDDDSLRMACCWWIESLRGTER
jgi:hypothetical protein